MKKQTTEIVAVSQDKGSICFLNPENNNYETWLFVAENVKPFLRNVRKGKADIEFDEESGLITFAKNTGVAPSQASTGRTWQANKFAKGSETGNAAMMTRYATDIFIKAYELAMNSNKEFDAVAVAKLAGETVASMHNTIKTKIAGGV